jgi:chromosome segregation protein
VFLKSLEIFGFKSFADRAKVDFSEGISALLGPNGCGKSNVVDAIKWVVGEQSARSLRAESMEDIIFNGTETSYPLCSLFADRGRI